MAPSFDELRREMNRLGDKEERLIERIAKSDQEIESLRSLTTGREQERKAAKLELKELQKEKAALINGSNGAAVPTTAINQQRALRAGVRWSSVEVQPRSSVSRKSLISDSTCYPVLHPNYPTVLIIDGKATSIACHICGANMGIAGFFAGLPGLLKHVVKGHRVENLTIQKLASCCDKTMISTSDASLIKAGSAPIMPIKMTRSAAAGPESRDGQASTTHVPAHPSSNPKHSALEMLVDYTGPIHANYGCVVFLDGEWVAISCHQCGANSSIRNRAKHFLTGINGLVSHINATHKRSSGSLANVLATCRRQEIAPDDVPKILAGEIVPGLVEKVTTNDLSAAPFFQHEDSVDDVVIVSVTETKKRLASQLDPTNKVKPDINASAYAFGDTLSPVAPPPACPAGSQPLFLPEPQTLASSSPERHAKQPRADSYTGYLGHTMDVTPSAVKNEYREESMMGS